MLVQLSQEQKKDITDFVKCIVSKKLTEEPSLAGNGNFRVGRRDFVAILVGGNDIIRVVRDNELAASILEFDSGELDESEGNGRSEAHTSSLKTAVDTDLGVNGTLKQFRGSLSLRFVVGLSGSCEVQLLPRDTGVEVGTNPPEERDVETTAVVGLEGVVFNHFFSAESFGEGGVVTVQSLGINGSYHDIEVHLSRGTTGHTDTNTGDAAETSLRRLSDEVRGLLAVEGDWEEIINDLNDLSTAGLRGWCETGLFGRKNLDGTLGGDSEGGREEDGKADNELSRDHFGCFGCVLNVLKLLDGFESLLRDVDGAVVQSTLSRAEKSCRVFSFPSAN